MEDGASQCAAEGGEGSTRVCTCKYVFMCVYVRPGGTVSEAGATESRVHGLPPSHKEDMFCLRTPGSGPSLEAKQEGGGNVGGTGAMCPQGGGQLTARALHSAPCS